jgi:glycosyltransferase involved in cell wall biosynthesis
VDKLGCVAIVKNEERHIAEWLAWQFCLGFDTVLLFDNGSTDDTVQVARSFAPRLDVRVIPWASVAPDFQVRAYEHAVRLLDGAFDWLAFFDTDEFLVLDEGLALRPLLAARPEAAVVVSWAMFGASGHQEKPEGLVTENFLYRAPDDFPPNRHVKSIVRPGRVRHGLNAHFFAVEGAYVDLRGRALSWDLPGYLSAPAAPSGARLHHYFTRSFADWQDKLRRGNPAGERPMEEFEIYDRNEVFDDSALRLVPQLAALLHPEPVKLRLGIAITTFNRRDTVLNMVTAIRTLTGGAYDLVICDDGSTDGTVEALRQCGERVIGGVNRGIAWNKNRGLYYLLNIARSDVVVLLDDDIIPVEPGWEQAWIAAAWRLGHVNHAHPAYRASLAGGGLTAQDPGLAGTIPGWALAFNRYALATAGYFDLRFGRYGHEHSDFSFRLLRAGFGGIQVQGPTGGWQALFYVIRGGLEGVASVTSGTPAELETNGRLLGALGNDPIYRHAWRSDEEMRIFLDEILQALPPRGAPALYRTNTFPSLSAYQQSLSDAADLIFDIGMAEGNDTAFYLAKGFRVVGVEPDVRIYYGLMQRFEAEIAAGRLFIHNLAAGARHGDIVEFVHHERHQGLSGLSNSRAEFALGFQAYHVMTIDWPALIARHGVPHYAKIDIEGQALAFLGSAVNKSQLPDYISVECQGFEPVQALYNLGYRRFMLVDQNPPGGFALPAQQQEGQSIDWPHFVHASGPFGRDLTGKWVSFERFHEVWQAARSQMNHTWFDCHARLP